MSLKNIRSWAPLILSALLLVACGGGDPYVPGSGSPSGAPTAKGNFMAIVSFGTSPSDLGTYTPATVIPGTNPPVYIGGKFTTNSATGTVWIENLAASLGLIITPAEVGYDGVSVKCPAAANPALANTCTGYGQAGARVTDPNGVGHDPATGKGALTVPLTKQIDNHLARFTSFKSTDLIFVEGGLNDLFTAFGTFGATAAAITDPAGSVAANQKLFAAQTAAQAAMKQAAVELAGYVRTKILANGGKYVVVATIPDLKSTPFGQTLPVDPTQPAAVQAAQRAALQAVLTSLSDTFNLWLREGLTNQPVELIDLRDFFNTVVANPSTSTYSFANVTTPACDAAKISALTGGLVTTGTSLFCNSTVGAPFNGLAAGADPLTWFFADGEHPTTGGHKLLSDIATQQLKAFGWI
jgi:outer membrane lipase/esterase